MTARIAIALTLGLALLGAVACASGPTAQFGDRRARAERVIEDTRLGDDPSVNARRAELEASVARQGDVIALDSLELRTTASHETDQRVELLARIPLEDLFRLPARRAVRRAQSEVALAELEDTTLVQRVAWCLPSIDRLVHAERKAIFEGYATRTRELLDWTSELGRAGQLDEVSRARFELESEVRLATRVPVAAPMGAGAGGDFKLPAIAAILPEAKPASALLDDTPALLRDELIRNQPELGIYRARRARFEAQAQRARVQQFPALRFVDVGYEALAYPGDTRELQARAAFEIPFGFAARANERRYRALGREQNSEERAALQRRLREGALALSEINAFRARATHWSELLETAATAEALADRWARERLAAPNRVSDLLDEIYTARAAVLDARERAGRAGCELLGATGVAPEAWPLRQASRSIGPDRSSAARVRATKR